MCAKYNSQHISGENRSTRIFCYRNPFSSVRQAPSDSTGLRCVWSRPSLGTRGSPDLEAFRHMTGLIRGPDLGDLLCAH